MTHARSAFVAAVHALSDDPGQANVERYLAASRALETSPATTSSESDPDPASPVLLVAPVER